MRLWGAQLFHHTGAPPQNPKTPKPQNPEACCLLLWIIIKNKCSTNRRISQHRRRAVFLQRLPRRAEPVPRVLLQPRNSLTRIVGVATSWSKSISCRHLRFCDSKPECTPWRHNWKEKRKRPIISRRQWRKYQNLLVRTLRNKLRSQSHFSEKSYSKQQSLDQWQNQICNS